MMSDISICWDDFILSYSAALDLISPQVVEHHYDVAYITSELLHELGAASDMVRSATQAALLHDVGVFSLKDKLAATAFEFEDENLHADLGAELFAGYKPLEQTSKIIRYHHCRYDEIQYFKQVPYESQVVYLADRIAISIDKSVPIFQQKKAVVQKIKGYKHTKFNPVLVEAFESLATKESFWLKLQHEKKSVVASAMAVNPISVQYDELVDISTLFARIIDFKSMFTAAHSRGVGAIASQLGEYAGISEEEQKLVFFTGVVHDLGKIIIPTEILDKPSVITKDEMSIIRAHPYYTHLILKSFKGLEKYTSIASQHHERLDASGYPYHMQGSELTRDARLVAVADVFTALTEDRAYRESLKPEKVKEAMNYFVKNNYLDRDLVKLALEYQDVLTKANKSCQERALTEYEAINQTVNNRKSKS
jgi:putative nucleotidyltransferase with HDIG domain